MAACRKSASGISLHGMTFRMQNVSNLLFEGISFASLCIHIQMHQTYNEAKKKFQLTGQILQYMVRLEMLNAQTEPS